MSKFEEFKELNRKAGCWPKSKHYIYEEAYEKALEDAARAVGITVTALKSIIGSNAK